jgi:hypothetical protein
MAFSGLIDTFQVSSNSNINNLTGGLVNNALRGVVNVAVSPVMSGQLSKTLGFPPVPTPGNLLRSIVTPGLLDLGNQTITDAITSSLINSKALSPAGPLVADLASQVVGGAFNSLTGGLLSSLLPGSSLAGAVSEPTRYFPGAGGEEDANYGGYAFTPGPVGPDVVFSIKPASSTASTDAAAQVDGNGAGVPGNTGVNELVSGASGNSPVPTAVQTSAYSGTMESLTSGTPANFPIFKSPTSSIFDTTASFSPGLTTTPSPGVPATLTSQQIADAYSGSTAALAPSLTNIPTFDTTQPLSVGTADFFSIASLVPEVWKDPELLATIESLNFGFAFSAQQGQADGWKFTTAPGNITWETAAKVDKVPIFGTNQPPVISGSRGMRELSMSDALIEGFSMGKAVEGKIAKLESLLNFTLTTSYVKVPVYWVCAQDKRYGASNDEGGYFVIKQIKVKEEMRDLTGNSTRAMVDISFTQVPSYQVDDGRDLASQSIAGGTSILSSVEKQVDKNYAEQRAKEKALEANKPGSGGKPGDKNNDKVLYNGSSVNKFSKRTIKGVQYLCTFDGKGGYTGGPAACKG